MIDRKFIPAAYFKTAVTSNEINLMLLEPRDTELQGWWAGESWHRFCPVDSTLAQ